MGSAEPFTFIDLFAGVGGMRMAFERLGGRCVFSSEIDPKACKVYENNFGQDPYFDITTVDPERDLNFEFDILLAGFPCQAFSMAGKRRGFDDERGRGRLFDYIELILKAKRPKAFLLENVKGLVSHDKGRTMAEILRRLRAAGYVVPKPKILNAVDYNVPQKRERVYIVGFRDDLGIDESDFRYPDPPSVPDDERRTLRSALEEDVDRKYYLSQGYLDCLKRHKENQREEGRGFGYAVLDPDRDLASNTLMTGGMGRERNLILWKPLDDYSPTAGKHSEINRENIRCLTPREFANLQGFPGDFDISGVPDGDLYRLFGNSVAIDVVRCVGDEMLDTLTKAGRMDDPRDGRGRPDGRTSPVRSRFSSPPRRGPCRSRIPRRRPRPIQWIPAPGRSSCRARRSSRTSPPRTRGCVWGRTVYTPGICARSNR